MRSTNKPLILTLGDPAGIGPDIALLAHRARATEQIPPFLLIGDPDVVAERARMLGADIALAVTDDPATAVEAFPDALPILPLPVRGRVTPGAPAPESAEATERCIRLGVELVRAGSGRAIVTNPISKAVLTRAGFPFPGHTEFLAHLAGRDPSDAVMMLASDTLRVVPVTIHLPLSEVFGALTEARIVKTLETTASALTHFFGIAEPRLAIAGLNPHAGEDGTMGDEEIRIIEPAIAAARAQGLSVSGPHPADTLFHAEARRTYDAAIAMYHDQALIPFKTLFFDAGVNVTLGLPFIRTSPDHGTAFLLAGTGRARPQSLIAALRLAEEMHARAEAVA
jgi:4-hydroxythreonine-4-phosphate dehydrogenase